MIDMNTFFIVLMAGFVVLILLTLIRVFKGPTVYDRLNGLGLIGVAVIMLLVLMGFIMGREDMYLDIAVSYSILGFVGSLVIARFLLDEVNRK